MTSKQYALIVVLILVAFFFSVLANATQMKIHGEYCYQYGDSESLMIAKEISYAMALRKAIENYKTFVASTSIVKDFQLKKDLVETIASGYVENIRIIRQEVKGRTVCTTLVGYVNPDAIKGIISKKVERSRKIRSGEFKGLLCSKNVKILYHKKALSGRILFPISGASRVIKGVTWDEITSSIDWGELNEADKEEIKKIYQRKLITWPGLFIVYQAKVPLRYHSSKIIVDCFEKSGTPLEGKSKLIPEEELSKGEVRKIHIRLPAGTVSFGLGLEDL